jgi:hypothetical protein
MLSPSSARSSPPATRTATSLAARRPVVFRVAAHGRSDFERLLDRFREEHRIEVCRACEAKRAGLPAASISLRYRNPVDRGAYCRIGSCGTQVPSRRR